MIKKGITPKITSFQKLQTDSKFMLNVDIDELVRLYVRRWVTSRNVFVGYVSENWKLQISKIVTRIKNTDP